MLGIPTHHRAHWLSRIDHGQLKPVVLDCRKDAREDNIDCMLIGFVFCQHPGIPPSGWPYHGFLDMNQDLPGLTQLSDYHITSPGGDTSLQSSEATNQDSKAPHDASGPNCTHRKNVHTCTNTYIHIYIYIYIYIWYRVPCCYPPPNPKLTINTP